MLNKFVDLQNTNVPYVVPLTVILRVHVNSKKLIQKTKIIIINANTKKIYIFIYMTPTITTTIQPTIQKTLLMLPFKCLLNTKQKKTAKPKLKNLQKNAKCNPYQIKKTKTKTKTCENSVNRFAVNLCAVLANVPNLNAVLHIRRILWPDTMMVPLRCAWTP